MRVSRIWSAQATKQSRSMKIPGEDRLLLAPVRRFEADSCVGSGGRCSIEQLVGQVNGVETIMGHETEVVTTGSVVSADGTRIGFRRLGRGPSVILLHGGVNASQHMM